MLGLRGLVGTLLFIVNMRGRWMDETKADGWQGDERQGKSHKC